MPTHKLLSEPRIRAAKPKEKPYKLRDERGLYLLVMPSTNRLPSGAKLWRLRYLHPTKMRPPTEREKQLAAAEGKTATPQRVESMLSLGSWPDVLLDEAREQRDAERRHLAQKIDPSAKRKAEKLGNAHTFETVAREWLETQRPGLVDKTFERAETMLESVFPHIGAMPIAAVTRAQVLTVIKGIEQKGKLETARRVGQRCAQVFQYALNTGRAQVNPVASRKGAMAKRKKPKKHAGITDPARIGELLRAIDGYTGSAVTSYALKLSPLVFVRPGELRGAEWAEVDMDAAMWRIPAEKMKMRRPHIVPLSKQAVTLLRELKTVTGNGRYVFPAMTTPTRSLSENTVNMAIRRLGYDNTQMTAHGFRTMATTRLNEGWGKHRFKSDWIEAQQAHAEGDSVRAAYNEAEYLDDRRRMMQLWADYLDGLKRAAAAKVAA
jgi:integrase